MGISLKPVIGCNLGCRYCYEANVRHTGNAPKQYDLEAMKAGIRRESRSAQSGVTMHGGEFLLLPKEDAEALFQEAAAQTKHLSIQTNGTLVDAEWIDMFVRYRVSVGVSMDGPWPLNRGRWAGSDSRTEAMTLRTMDNIRAMRRAGLEVGVICVLSKIHVTTPNALALMESWLGELAAIGVNGGRFNEVHVDDPALQDEYELTNRDMANLYRGLGDIVFRLGSNWQPFRDVQDLLLGLPYSTCVYNSCDPLATAAEQFIMGDGNLGNCLKTAKEGIAYLQEEGGEHHERETLLALTPQEYGGCAGCKYWRICRGHCPSEAIHGDYRNRSRYCEAHFATYEFVESRMKAMFPNLRTSCDFNEWWPDDYQSRRDGTSTFEPFAMMSRRHSQSPSSWRVSAMAVATNQTNPWHPNQHPPQNVPRYRVQGVIPDAQWTAANREEQDA